MGNIGDVNRIVNDIRNRPPSTAYIPLPPVPQQPSTINGSTTPTNLLPPTSTNLFPGSDVPFDTTPPDVRPEGVPDDWVFNGSFWYQPGGDGTAMKDSWGNVTIVWGNGTYSWQGNTYTSLNDLLIAEETWAKEHLGGAPWLIGSAAAYSQGGIVTAPTIALIGESGAEAIIPLKGDRSTWGHQIEQVGDRIESPQMQPASQYFRPKRARKQRNPFELR